MCVNPGVVTTLAGGATVGSVDGTGTAALFNTPCSIAVSSSSENLFVADRNNNVIRMISPTGTIFAVFK